MQVGFGKRTMTNSAGTCRGKKKPLKATLELQDICYEYIREVKHKGMYCLYGSPEKTTFYMVHQQYVQTRHMDNE